MTCVFLEWFTFSAMVFPQNPIHREGKVVVIDCSGGKKKKRIFKCHMSIFGKVEDVFICAKALRSLQGYSIQSVYLY